MKLLDIKNLNITVDDNNSELNLVHDLNFHVKKGEIFGIVGESGCGKSITTKSIMRLLEPRFHSSGTICYLGKNLLSISEKEMCKMRGKNISIVFQDALSALNPLKKIGKQLHETLKIHIKNLNKKDREKKIFETLEECDIYNPEETCKKYPHELSGGQRQRILIAMAVICEPCLIICDESTTALDLRTQLRVIKLLKKLNKEKNMTIMFVSHDIALIESICDRVMVMYAGRSVEIIEGSLKKALHPYTRALYSMLFSMEDKNKLLPYVVGTIIEPAKRNFNKCFFGNRCKYFNNCKENDLYEIEENHFVACEKVINDAIKSK
ncbi:MAG: ABC transporter ATP-binding protein [Fusobacterium sp. JB021]|nr:ABC transporter ATP-binding protein [Fusobacterium sp. JB020]MDP0493767.1 ABC transporter ATP-binding protein [Fusobacterium sp. JB021]MDP0507251.1 ABC transporter ATP-binding protein [Fusobacterium sp. JB019]